MTRFVFTVLFAGAISGWAQGLSRPQTSNVPVLKVCELLDNVSAYDGKPLIVLGHYRSWAEGVVLEETCNGTPQSIWLDYYKPGELPPLDVPDYLQHKATIIGKLPAQESLEVDILVDCQYSGLWAAIFGRFATNQSLPINPRTGKKIGFGHLEGWQTQLTYSSAGFWCLVPSVKRDAVAQEMTDRDERARVSIWRHLRAVLEGPEGPTYFDTSVQGRIIQAVQGFVVSTDSEEHPKLIDVSVTDTITPEARLVLNKPLNTPVQPGMKIKFDGTAVDFSRSPYRIVFDVVSTAVAVTVR